MSKRTSTFVSSFIRQLGRETAHDTYRTATSSLDVIYDCKEYIDGTFTVKYKFADYLLLAAMVINILIPIPIFPLVVFITGCKRVLGENIKGYQLGNVDMYKHDNRTRSGRKYLGTEQMWLSMKKPRLICSEENIKKARYIGLFEMITSGAIIILHIVVFVCL